MDSGAQVSAINAEQLQKHCPGTLIKDIQDLLGIELELVTANGTQFPYIGWSIVNFEIGKGLSLQTVEVPILVTTVSLDSPIIGYTVVEILVMNTAAPHSDSLPGVLHMFGTLSEERVAALINLMESEKRLL